MDVSGGFDEFDEEAEGRDPELDVCSSVSLGGFGVAGGVAALIAEMLGGFGEVRDGVGEVVEDGLAASQGSGDGACGA